MGFIETQKAKCMLSVLVSTPHAGRGQGSRHRALLLFILGLAFRTVDVVCDLPQGHRRQAAGKHEIEIWGVGEQTRSSMCIDDCTDGTIRLAARDIVERLNIGSDELVSINRLVDIVEKIAGVKLKRKLDVPKGVRGPNSDND